MRKPELLAAEIEAHISSGVMRPGERIHSVRELSRLKGVGLNTAVRAHEILEDRGLVVTRPQSGTYVVGPRQDSGITPPRRRLSVPREVDVPGLVSLVFESAQAKDLVPLGAACLTPDLYPCEAINRFTRQALREAPELVGGYALPPGQFEYRRQISRRLAKHGCSVDPAEVVATNGAMEALSLALRATCAPGSAVLIESPQYFGILQALQQQELRVVELPTHPRDGVDLAQVEEALEKFDIGAGLFIPNFSNPLGTLMDDARKAQLVDLFARHDVPLIEDDIYAELSLQGGRPRPLKAFDRRGGVLTCSSFSKTVSPGLRAGWMLPGRYLERVKALQCSSSMGAGSLSQAVLAGFLASKEYERHMASLRTHFSLQVGRVSNAVRECFPEGTRLTTPRGGFVLWVELPRGTDAVELSRRALESGISISPGILFSASNRYRNHLRLNCGNRWTPSLARALAKLGELAKALVPVVRSA
ncbi:PLP-dependent aminotransferase family protein [Pyxidicoccus parkwayensis]|uniref:PLP-dependent aminotransferase family protein n=1 Tax=Pyxidicoccus parkwayensis TaxID=2813578 RepID=A0ABX7P269_9BACT|nr:PLP-dependent aminotransferase family protein [Pyxidicoccus parkwaysis]QSQ24481.1 PLP-dependent aminotransferase family protein [Pyxidicoccus parkwaysis]